MDILMLKEHRVDELTLLLKDKKYMVLDKAGKKLIAIGVAEDVGNSVRMQQSAHIAVQERIMERGPEDKNKDK